MLRKIYPIVLLMLLPFAGKSQLFINEISSANAGAIADDNGDWSDWFEVYLKTGSSSIDLRNYCFSNDRSNPTLWRIPSSVTMAAGNKYVIFASGKDRYKNSKAHTNFKLNQLSNNAELIMSDTNGNIIETHVVGGIASKHTYSRIPDGSTWYISDKPTPGNTNAGTKYTAYCQAPNFTPESGVFNQKGGKYKLTVAMTSPDNAAIYFTTDGSYPTQTKGYIYSAANQKKYLIFDSTKVIKAICIKTGLHNSPQQVQTYFVNDSLYGSVVSMSAGPDSFFKASNNIYFANGEREGYFELLDKNGKTEKQFGCVMTTHGNYSRSFAQKSIRVKTKPYMDSSVCGGDIFWNKKLPELKSFNVRNAGVDWFRAHMRDELIHTLAASTNQDVQVARTVKGYINGQFYGMYHIRERQDNDYCYENHGVNPDSIDMFHYSSGNPMYGSAAKWNRLVDTINKYASSNLFLNDTIFENATKYVDRENWTDYFFTETYVINHDWPGNNIRWWGPQGGNKKFRFMLWDLDFGFGITWGTAYQASEDYFGNTMSGGGNPAGLIKIMLKNPKFKKYFINRYADLINTAFHHTAVLNTLKIFVDSLYADMDKSFKRWSSSGFNPPGGTSTNYAQWAAEINVIKTFSYQRNQYARKYIKDYSDFSLSDTVNLIFDVSPASAGRMKVSTIYPASFPWKGTYFNGNKVPITAMANPGYTFSHWSGDALSANDSNISIDKNFTKKGGRLTANFVATGTTTKLTLNITEVHYNSDKKQNAGNWMELTNYGTSDIDLSEWKLNTNIKWIKYVFSTGTTMPAKTRWILCSDTNLFRSQYSNITALLIQTGIELGNTKDDIDLIDNQGKTIVSIHYTDAQPWPLAADGYGRNMELINDTLVASNPYNWRNGCMRGSPGAAFSKCNEFIKVSEINFHPPKFAASGDWFELYNHTSSTIDLSNYLVRNKNVYNTFVFPANTKIAPGNRLVCVGDTTAFRTVNPTVGNYVSLQGMNLNNGFDVIRIFTPSDSLVFSVAYDDHGTFTQKADGQGYSLELKDSADDFSDGGSWFSACMGGSPGTTPANCIGGILFTEVNYKSASFNDAGDWFEIKNSLPTDLNISGWGVYGKDTASPFKIPTNTILKSGNYMVFISDSVKFKSMYPHVKNYIGNFNFGLKAGGGDIRFLDGTKLIAAMTYDDTLAWPQRIAGTGYTLEVKDTVAWQSDPKAWKRGCLGGSPGGAFVPCDDSIYVSEINFNSNTNADAGDWIEIWNTHKVTKDISGWLFQDNNLQDTFLFPSGTVLQPNDRIVVSNKKSKLLNLFPNAPNVLGDFNFGLSSLGDHIVLRDPNSKLRYGVAYYIDSTWDYTLSKTNGGSYTLEWKKDSIFASQPQSWTTACPCGSPGKIKGACGGALAITEVNYNSDVSLNSGDWFEVLNTGLLPVEPTGFRLQNGDSSFVYTFTKAPVFFKDEYLVFCYDTVRFKQRHSGVRIAGNFNFDLVTNKPQTIKLRDGFGNLFATASFDGTSSNWPLGANGNGRTQERTSIYDSAILSTSWFDGCLEGSPGTAYQKCDDKVVISEINHSPSSIIDAGQWIEIWNKTNSNYDLSYFTLKNNYGQKYDFPQNSVLGANQRVVLCADSNKFRSIFPNVALYGQINFSLQQNDILKIYSKQNEVISQVSYNGSTIAKADGKGYTLEGNDTLGNTAGPSYWFAGCLGGSPGTAYSPCSNGAVLTEMQLASGTWSKSGDWLEFKNNSSSFATMDGWEISNANGSLTGQIHTDRIMKPGDYIVVTPDSSLFASYHNTYNHVSGGYYFDDNADTLKIYNEDHTLVYAIPYDFSKGWSQAAYLTGRTLERASLSNDPNLGSSWFGGCLEGSPGKDYSTCTENLVFSEINYQSHQRADVGDWFEVWNTSSQLKDLSGFNVQTIQSTQSFVLPANTIIPAGFRLVVVSDKSKFDKLFPVQSFLKAEANFNLSVNDGVVILDKAGKVVAAISYDTSTWPKADASGYTIALNDTSKITYIGSNWANYCIMGSPGVSNSVCSGDATISEMMFKPHPKNNTGDWIELANTNANPIDISNYLMVNTDSSKTFIIPEKTIMLKGERLVFANDLTNFTLYNNGVSALAMNGFDLADTGGYIKMYNTKRSMIGIFGFNTGNGWPNEVAGTGRSIERDMNKLATGTYNAWFEGCIGGSPGNSYAPCQYPLVVSEINYNPGQLFDAGQWLELKNNSNSTLLLDQWRVDAGALSYKFSGNLLLQSKKYQLLNKDDTKLAQYWPNVTNHTTWTALDLPKQGSIELFDTSGKLKFYINYSNSTPWPLCADGLEYTLELSDTTKQAFNNTASWFCGCAAGSPGNVYTTPCTYTGLQNISNKKPFAVYPNPSSGMVIIESPYNTGRIVIIDATGKQVGAYDLQTKTVLDLSPFAKGIYLIRIVTNAETLEQKIVLR